MNKNYIDPIDNFFIRYFFGSEENKDLLLSFINSVFEDAGFMKIVEVNLKDPFNLKKLKDDKETILDVKAVDEFGRTIDVEIQTSGKGFAVSKSLYYWAQLFCSQLKEGEKYWDLKPVISINLINFKLFDDMDRIHTSFSLKDYKDPNLKLSDHLQMHFLELPKYDGKDFHNQLRKWFQFFKYEGKEEEKMATLAKNDPIFQKARRVYKHFTIDDDVLEVYYARRKWLLEQASLEEGYEMAQKELKAAEARAYKAELERIEAEAKAHKAEVDRIEAEAKARAELNEAEAKAHKAEVERIEAADETRQIKEQREKSVRKLHKQGMDNSSIADVMGLPADEVERILATG